MDGNLSGYSISKVFNNNVLLVSKSNSEKILLGKGIGYGKRINDSAISIKNIDKVFTLEDEKNSSKFKTLIEQVDSKTVGLCEELIYMISKELNEDLNEKIHISLTDHIAFTLFRLKNNDEIQNPFLVETEILYKHEYELAQKAVNILKKTTFLDIPEGEIGFIALHIHSARNKGKLSNTIKYAYLANSVAELIEEDLDIELNRTSLDYARFLTHLRFAIERLLKNCPIENKLLSTIKRRYRDSYKIAKKVGELISNELDVQVMEDETGFIAIHIERLRSAI